MICSQCLSYSGTHVNGQASVFWSNQVQEAGLTHSGLGRTPSCHADSYFFLNLRGNGSGAPKEEMFRERMSPPPPHLKSFRASPGCWGNVSLEDEIFFHARIVSA